MIGNRSRRWSLQFVILPLLRDDSSALKPLSTLGERRMRSWGCDGNATGIEEVWVEKLLFSEISRGSYLCYARARTSHIHRTQTRPLRSWTNFVANGKDLRQALEKFLQFFDKALHLSPRVSLSRAQQSRGSLQRVEHHTRAYSSGFCSSGIHKARPSVHIQGNGCMLTARG